MLRVDIVGGGAAETRDERARLLAAERAEFAGENDELSRERLDDPDGQAKVRANGLSE